jgi:hypothetical protein
MGWDGVEGLATLPPAPDRKKCSRSVAALLPFLLPVISLTINSVTDVAGFPSIMLISVLSIDPLQAWKVNESPASFRADSRQGLPYQIPPH